MSALRIGLIGWGTVGSALGGLVLDGPLPLELARVAVRDPARPRAAGLSPSVPLVSPDEATAGVEVVVELAGGVEGPLGWARAALSRGIPYVTANKALLATHGDELADLAARHGASLLGSASVGGGTPMVEAVAHLAASGGITGLRGLLNATTTYILSAMGEGRSYADALREAQEAGYAEADASFDVEGRDAAQKLAILASVAWGRWRPESDVERRGIVGAEIAAGQLVRLVAEAVPDRLSVGPMQLEAGSPLAGATGVDSMLEIETAGGAVFRVSGPGAGGSVTARAVYADLARLAAGERPILFRGAA